MFVSTLEDYYDYKKVDQFDELFQGLYIHENPTPSKNSYFVMHFDFSGIATKDFETIMSGFAGKVRTELKRFVSYYDIPLSEEITMDATPATMLNSVLGAVQRMESEYNVCILIDEYDHFTNAVLEKGLTDFLTLVKRGGIVRSFV